MRNALVAPNGIEPSGDVRTTVPVYLTQPDRRRHMIRLRLTFNERRTIGERVPVHNGRDRNHVAEVAPQSTNAG